MEGEYLAKLGFCRNGSRYYRKSQVELCVKNTMSFLKITNHKKITVKKN